MGHLNMEKKSLEWKLIKLLSSLYKIIDYELITDASENDYPSPFCAHRWVENERVQRKPDQCGIISQSSLITGRLYQRLNQIKVSLEHILAMFIYAIHTEIRLYL